MYSETDHFAGAMLTDSVPTLRCASQRKPLVAACVALLIFMIIYFSRPEDWIPGLSKVPLAKITVTLALLALAFSVRHIRQRFPREVLFLSLLIGQLFVASLLSSVWRSGAFQTSLAFAKVFVIFIMVTAAVTTFRRLRLLICSQALSVSAIAAVAIWKGRLVLGRLEGLLGGNYSDPNDLALAIIISLPLCLALLFLSRGVLQKVAWAIAILVMLYAVFLTGSRGGFVALIVTAVVFLWEIAIQGRRRYLLALTVLASVILWQFSSNVLVGRLKGTLNANDDTAAAYASGQARWQLFWRSVKVTEQHPLFGVGPGNFDQVSGQWHTTHNSFTLMSAEGGLPAFVLYVLILYRGFKNLRASKRLAPRRPESRLLAGALFASLAGYAVGSFFLSVAYAFFPYILVAYTTALLSIVRRSAVYARKIEPVRQKNAGETIQFADGGVRNALSPG